MVWRCWADIHWLVWGGVGLEGLDGCSLENALVVCVSVSYIGICRSKEAPQFWRTGVEWVGGRGVFLWNFVGKIGGS